MVAGPVPPASADTVIARPADGATLNTSSVTVTGRAEAQTALDLPLGRLESVTLRIGEETVTSPGCRGVRTCEFTGTFTLRRNGPYSVAVEAITTGFANAGPPPSRTFSVAAPAARPVLDPPTVTASRGVALSWSRNTEPDVLQYEIVRTDPGGSRLPLATVQQLDEGPKMTLTDTTAVSLAGGTYTYEVRAVRRGATATARVFSEYSKVASATVPATATTSSTVATVPPAGGPTTTAKPGAPAGVDLSGFLSSRPQPIPLPAITVPQPPDTGFSGSLPFGVGPAGEELEEGDAEAVLPSDRRRSSSVVGVDAGRPLVPIAGGLVLLLLALHMRLLGRRVKAAPDGDLPVELGHEPPGPAPAPAPQPEPEPEPEPVVQTAIYDVAADEGYDWAARQSDPEPMVMQPLVMQPLVIEPIALDLDAEYEDDDSEATTDDPELVTAGLVAPDPDPDPDPGPGPGPDDEDWAAVAILETIALEPEPDDKEWAPAAINLEPLEPVAPEPEPVAPEPEPAPVEPEPVPPEPGPEPEREPEPMALWRPSEVTDEVLPPADFDPDEIEVVEVVSSSRRRLVRAGGR